MQSGSIQTLAGMLAKSEFSRKRSMFRSFSDAENFFSVCDNLIILLTIIWFDRADIGEKIVGFNIDEDAEPIIGLGYFISHKFIWFYLYYLSSWHYILLVFGLDIFSSQMVPVHIGIIIDNLFNILRGSSSSCN